MLRSVYLILFLTASLARAADPAVTLYAPDPADPWNRLHNALFLRTAPTGETFGLDAVDPLLWTGTRHHLLDGTSHASAVAALDAALTAPVPEDPLKRAVLQRDLWSVFDWCAARRTAPAAELQVRLAKLLQRLALTADEILALPDSYAAAAASRRFPAADDPEHPSTPFLPPDLFEPAGPWVPLRYAGDNDDGTIAPRHARDFGDRSVFEAFFRHPDGRRAGLDYLDRLATFYRDHRGSFPPDPDVPQFPVGSAFALVRRAVFFDRAGQLHPTRLVESVQLRVYRRIEHSLESQSVHEFILARADLLADPSRALRPVAPEERGVASAQFDNPGTDPFESNHLSPPGRRAYAFPVLRACVQCHAFPGIHSVLSFARPATPRRALAESAPDLQPSLAIQSKQARPEWTLLRDLLTTPEP